MRNFPWGCEKRQDDHGFYFGAGSLLSYGGYDGNGWTDGKIYGDGYGGSSGTGEHIYFDTTDYPYFLIQYW